MAGHQKHLKTRAHLVCVGGGLTLVLRLALLSGRLRDKKLIATHTREHSDATAGEGAQIMPCPRSPQGCPRKATILVGPG